MPKPSDLPTVRELIEFYEGDTCRGSISFMDEPSQINWIAGRALSDTGGNAAQAIHVIQGWSDYPQAYRMAAQGMLAEILKGRRR